MLWRKSERTQLLHVSVQSLNCQSRPFFWARHTQCTGTTEILCIWSERIPSEQIWALWQFSLLTFRDPAGPVTKQFPTLQRPFAAASRLLQFGKPCRTRRLLSVPGRHRGQALLPELVFKPSSYRWAPTTGNKFPRTCDVCNSSQEWWDREAGPFQSNWELQSKRLASCPSPPFLCGAKPKGLYLLQLPERQDESW